MKLFAEPETFFPRGNHKTSRDRAPHHLPCQHARLAPHRRDLRSCIRPSPSALCKAWSRRAPTPRGVSEPIETSSPHLPGLLARLPPLLLLPDPPSRAMSPPLIFPACSIFRFPPSPSLLFLLFVPAFLPVPSRPLPKPIFWSDLPCVSVSLSF